MCDWKKVKWLDIIQHKNSLYVYGFLATLNTQDKIEFEKLYRISKQITKGGY